jgi:hypothetical protein
MEQSVPLFSWLLAAGALKLLAEGAIFVWLPSRHLTPLSRTAQLMVDELGPTTLKRFFLGLAGGVVLPGALLACYAPPTPATLSPLFSVLAVVLILAACLAGEILERYLFFTAVVAPKMPGAPAT